MTMAPWPGSPAAGRAAETRGRALSRPHAPWERRRPAGKRAEGPSTHHRPPPGTAASHPLSLTTNHRPPPGTIASVPSPGSAGVPPANGPQARRLTARRSQAPPPPPALTDHRPLATGHRQRRRSAPRGAPAAERHSPASCPPARRAAPSPGPGNRRWPAVGGGEARAG